MKYSFENSKSGMVVLLCVLFAGMAVGDDPKITPMGYGAWECGEIVKGDHMGRPINRMWLNRIFTGFSLKTEYSERFQAIIGLEGQLWNPYDVSEGQSFGNKEYRRVYNILYLTRAEGTYSFGDNKNFSITAGLFPYKYNSNVRNLGEYMFRTTTYPGLIFNDFDRPGYGLMGFKLASDLLDGRLHQDLFFTSATRIYPLYDYSLSYIADFTPLRLITIGGGVMLDRVVPISDSKTTPHIPGFGWIDTTKPGSDTTWYTFAGTKIMGRISIDPKVAMPFASIFGDEDLKIYSEAIILGLKNYPFWYDTLWQRIPVMFGFNIPTFKIFDVFAAEFEYYGCRYPMGFKPMENPGIPVPDIVDKSRYDRSLYIEDDWKYSFYLRKTVLDHVTLVVQAARDHMYTRFRDGYPDDFEAMNQKSHWALMTKATFNF